MTVAEKLDDSKSENPGPYYLHLQNLPPTATQAHIRQFFSGLPIPSGGISMHASGAVVAIYDREDAKAAIQMVNGDKTLLGNQLRVSNLRYKDMRRVKMDSTRRKLGFDTAGPETVIPPTNPDQLLYRPNKRIRPTTIPRKVGENLAKKFCPDEVDSPVGEVIVKKETPTDSGKKTRKQQLKTIKPTPVLTLKQFNLVYESEVF